jgi:hypothetical protein
MEYSDPFEKRVNITVGFAGVVMGAVAVIGNRSLGGVWDEGVLIGLVCTALVPFLLALEIKTKRVSGEKEYEFNNVLMFIFF